MTSGVVGVGVALRPRGLGHGGGLNSGGLGVSGFSCRIVVEVLVN